MIKANLDLDKFDIATFYTAFQLKFTHLSDKNV